MDGDLFVLKESKGTLAVSIGVVDMMSISSSVKYSMLYGLNVHGVRRIDLHLGSFASTHRNISWRKDAQLLSAPVACMASLIVRR